MPGLTHAELLACCERVECGAGGLAFLKVHGGYIADVLKLARAVRAGLDKCADQRTSVNPWRQETAAAIQDAMLRAAAGEVPDAD